MPVILPLVWNLFRRRFCGLETLQTDWKPFIIVVLAGPNRRPSIYPAPASGSSTGTMLQVSVFSSKCSTTLPASSWRITVSIRRSVEE
jgi:hypothetical protein